MANVISHRSTTMRAEDLQDYDCAGCGKSVRHTFRSLPMRWSAVPNNVSVYLCDECSAPCWEVFSTKQKEIVDALAKGGVLRV